MNKLEKILIGSKNKAKIERYSELLNDYALQVLGLVDLGLTESPQEIGLNAKENAHIKGVFYSERSGLPVFTEDESLYVDFLPLEQQPGPYVRRINGKDEATDEELLAYWDNLLKGVPKDKRTGKWCIAYCITMPDLTTSSIVIEHPITFFTPASKKVIPGWPMNSIQGPRKFNKPESELTDNEKQLLRTEADQEILNKIRELLVS